MRKLTYIALFTAVLAVELFVAVQPLMTGNIARVPYRRAERFAAWEAMSKNRTPETMTVFRKELRLASRYEMKQKLPKGAFIFAAFLLLDAVCLYPYWRTYKQHSYRTSLLTI